MNSERNPNIGSKRSLETKLKMSIAQKGVKREYVKRIWVHNYIEDKMVQDVELNDYINAGWQFGRTEATRMKLADSKLGTKDSDETRIRKSLAQSKYANSSGSHLKTSEFREYRRNMFIKNNPSSSMEARDKISARMRKRWGNDDYRSKMSEMFSNINTGSKFFYNIETKEFRRFKLTDEIPPGFQDATGKTHWVKDQNGKRLKVIDETKFTV